MCVCLCVCLSVCVCVCEPLLLRGHDDFNFAGGQRAFLDCAAKQRPSRFAVI